MLWRKEALVHILSVQGKAKPTFEGPLFDAFATNVCDKYVKNAKCLSFFTFPH